MKTWGLVVWAALVVPDPVIAEAGDRDAQATARQEFEEAMVALRGGDFPRARDLLRASLRRHSTPATAYNLAVALRGTGESVAAKAVLEELLSGVYGEVSEERRGEVEALLSDVREDTASVVLRLSGAPSVRVRIDGEPVGRVEEGGALPVEVDAGAHVVSARAEGFAAFEERVELGRGASEEVDIRLVVGRAADEGVLEVAGRASDTRIEVEGFGEHEGSTRLRLPPGSYTVRIDTEEGSRVSRLPVLPGHVVRLSVEPEDRRAIANPWLWVGIGSVLAVAGGVTALVLSGRKPERVTDPVFPVVSVLREAP